MRRFALPVLLVLTFAGCSGDEHKDVILPLVASFDPGDSPTADPVVFLLKSPADTVPSDDVVVVDVLLRSNVGTTFSAFTMEIHFDPGVIQVGQVDLTATPLGDCTSSTGLHPICADNVNSSTDPANDTGTLLVAVGSQSGGALANVVGLQKLFTLRFVGASVGTSDVTFTQGAGSGDCEILDAQVDLGVTCHNGAPPNTAHVVVTR